MNANACVEYVMDDYAKAVSNQFADANTIAIVGPILGALDLKLRQGVESIPSDKKKANAVVLLDTGGGVVELVERMVGVLRHHFMEVHFIIPDQAMSAGTIFALSGDSIWMDYFSCLGPIDPQIERDGKLVPALSYVVQYEELVRKSFSGHVSPAELLLLQKLDLADLHFYEQAKNLSVNLLVEWLSRYKFKDWVVTETRALPVTDAMKKDRAKEIAEALSEHTRWKTHGRPLPMNVLSEHLHLRINDFGAKPDLSRAVRLYFDLLMDYTRRVNMSQTVHTPGGCQ